MQVGTNRADPLVSRSSDQQRELLRRFGQAARGFTFEDVTGASVNLLANGLRQAHPTREQALARFDQLMTEARSIVADSYDATGKRRNVFPHTQNINVPLLKLEG